MDFKERIFQARKAKGFSQEELAEQVGVSRQAVSKWETGEAMPDLEKLIAVCQVLEQSMEYLALGRTAETPQPAPKKRKWWLAICAAAVCCALCFGMGFCWPRAQIQPPAQTQTQPQAQPQLQIQVGNNTPQRIPAGSPISNVTVDLATKKHLDIGVLPTELTEGLSVELLCEDKLGGKTETYDCTFDGHYYRIKLHRGEKYRYCITAVLTADGKKTQIPILDIDGNGNTFSTRHLWKEL